MVSASKRMALLIVVGVLLLGNGAWLYPQEVSHETRYTYEAEQQDYPPLRGTHEAEIRHCGAETPSSPDCAVAHYLADGNVIATDGGPASWNLTAVPEDFFDAPRTYYDLESGTYRGNATVEDGKLVLRFESVSRATLKRAVAENYSEVPDAVRRAVDDGRATSKWDIDPHYVERNGTYYEVRMTGWEHVPTGWGWTDPPLRVVHTLRWGGYLLGLAAVWYAGVLFGWVRWKD